MVPDHGGEEGVKAWVYVENTRTNGLAPVKAELVKTDRFLHIIIEELVVRVELEHIRKLEETNDGEGISESDLLR